jgi:hypothetical protein
MARNWVSTGDQSAYWANKLEFKTWMSRISKRTYLMIAVVAQRMVRLDKLTVFH